jgi:hypothetical protein
MIVQTEALTRALKLLVAANVQFAVIDAEGVKHGALEIAPKLEPKKRHQNHPRGAFLRHHEALTSVLAAGQSVVVPYGPFGASDDRESLRSSISAYCSRTWGNDTYITAVADAGIELLRVE